jgi:hypothetical protein
MTSLKWNQVNSWRLSRNHLIERADSRRLLDVAVRICGLHAQLMSAAELSLWARVESVSPTDIKNAIWRKRQLVKTWAMRGTLHLIAASDFPLYVAALSLHSHYRRDNWLRYHSITLDELNQIIEGVRLTLNSAGMTREQLAESIARRTRNPRLAELLSSGWGTLLKPAAFQGHLCFGPSQGQKITFVRPDQWIGAWEEIDSQEALKEILRRYLAVYGPAQTGDFARWWGLQPAAAKRLFKSLADEIEEVEIEGWRAWALASGIKEISRFKPSGSVRLLPHFDPYVLGAPRSCGRIIPQEHRDRIFRPSAWISPVVLVDGRMEGVWGYEKKRSQIEVKIEMFSPPAATVKRSIEREARRLGEFFEMKVKVDC